MAYAFISPVATAMVRREDWLPMPREPECSTIQTRSRLSRQTLDEVVARAERAVLRARRGGELLVAQLTPVRARRRS